MEEIKITAYDLIKETSAVSTEYGEKIYNEIIKAFKNNNKVILDFNNLSIITSTFLNAAIGQLYNKYNSTFLNENLKIENMAGEDLELLKRVVERAKEYFNDKKGFTSAVQGTLGNE